MISFINYSSLGEDMLNSIEYGAKTKCGYATVKGGLISEVIFISVRSSIRSIKWMFTNLTVWNFPLFETFFAD